MVRRSSLESAQGVLRAQKSVISRAQALEVMTMSALRHQLRAGGKWTKVLPGVYLTNGGLPTVSQQEMAALLYCGPDCMITGLAAARRHGVRVPNDEVIDVLVPASRKRQSVGFVRTHRTTRMPEQVWVSDDMRYVPAVRAVADTARFLNDPREALAVVADAVQHRRCSIADLAAELATGPSHGSADLRAALDGVADGVRSAAEEDLRALIKSAKLPTPLYNASLYNGNEFLARPDAWWPDAGVACEVDSREWHITPEGWERTNARHRKMSAQGIVVLPVTPRQLHQDRKALTSELRQAIEQGLKRPKLAIRTVPADD